MLWMLFLALTVIFWGSYNLFYKAITGLNMNTFLSILIVGIVSGLVAVPFLISKHLHGGISLSPKGLILSGIMGLCMGIGTIFFFYTFKSGASASVAIPIYAIGALMIGAIGGILIFKETLNFKVSVGIVLGIISIIFLTIK